MSKPSAAIFAAKAAAYLGRPYSEIDCQQLMENMLRDVGIVKNWAGSNAMARDMAWIGTPEECKRLFGSVPVGAWLYCWSNDGGENERGYRDGLGNYSHVGAKTGKGLGAIASSSSRGGVAESAFVDKSIPGGGWNRVGFCKLLDYGEAIERKLYGKAGELLGKMYYAECTGDQVRVRRTPGGEIIGHLRRGEVVAVTDDTNAEWMQVDRLGGGYVAAQYLSRMETESADAEKGNAAAPVTVLMDDEGNRCILLGRWHIADD